MIFHKKSKVVNLDHLHTQVGHSFRNVRQDIYNIFSWLNYLNDRIISIQGQLSDIPNKHSVRQEIKDIVERNSSRDAVSHLKSEISELNQELHLLSRKQRHIPFELDELRMKLRHIEVPSKTELKHEIKQIIEQDHDIGRLRHNLDSLNEQVHDLSGIKKTIPEEIEEIKSRLQGLINDQLKRPLPEDSKLDEINKRLIDIENQRKSNMRNQMVRRITRNSKEYIKNVIISMIRKYGKMPALKLKEMIVDDQGLCSKSSFYRILNEVQNEDAVGVIQKGKEKEIISR